MKLNKNMIFALPVLIFLLAMMRSFSVEAMPNTYLAANYLEESTFAPSADTYVASGPSWANNPLFLQCLPNVM